MPTSIKILTSTGGPSGKRMGRKDSNQIAFATVQKTIEGSEAETDAELDKATISAVMAALGRIGSKKGGKRRLGSGG